MSEEVVKCNLCGHVLISGSGVRAIFGKGTSIQCMKCGNKYTVGEENPKNEIRDLSKS